MGARGALWVTAAAPGATQGCWGWGLPLCCRQAPHCTPKTQLHLQSSITHPPACNCIPQTAAAPHNALAPPKCTRIPQTAAASPKLPSPKLHSRPPSCLPGLQMNPPDCNHNPQIASLGCKSIPGLQMHPPNYSCTPQITVASPKLQLHPPNCNLGQLYPPAMLC